MKKREIESIKVCEYLRDYGSIKDSFMWYKNCFKFCWWHLQKYQHRRNSRKSMKLLSLEIVSKTHYNNDESSWRTIDIYLNIWRLDWLYVILLRLGRPNLYDKTRFVPFELYWANSYLEAFHFDDFLDTIYNEHLLIFIDESNVACV